MQSSVPSCLLSLLLLLLLLSNVCVSFVINKGLISHKFTGPTSVCKVSPSCPPFSLKTSLKSSLETSDDFIYTPIYKGCVMNVTISEEGSVKGKKRPRKVKSRNITPS